MLTITALASGSKGNATLVSSPDSAFLIDCGLSRRELERRLRVAGQEPSDLDALVVTHLHGDHVGGGAVSLCRSLGIPLYIHEANEANLHRAFPRLRPRDGRETVVPFAFKPFRIGDMTVDPFEVPHDSDANTCGLVVERRARAGGRFAYTTDLGRIPEGLLERFAGCEVVMLEFNHDPEALAASPRPQSVRDRIAGNRGHLSNRQAAELTARLLAQDCGVLQALIVAHMSEECNSEAMVVSQLRETLGSDWPPEIDLVFAQQRQVAGPITLGPRGAARAI